jgi:ribosomal protein L29
VIFWILGIFNRFKRDSKENSITKELETVKSDISKSNDDLYGNLRAAKKELADIKMQVATFAEDLEP